MKSVLRLDNTTSPAKIQGSAPAWNNRILIVEDEREIAKVYTEILSPAPSQVTVLRSSRQKNGAESGPASSGPEFLLDVVHSAEEAISLVKHQLGKGMHYAMGFFDVLLGSGMDGLEMFREIHKIDPQLFAVFVTAYNDRSVDSIRNLLGNDKAAHWDYLNKPFNNGEILQKARNFVTLWNLHEESQWRREQMADAQKHLYEGERLAAVAAVARGVTHEFGNILLQIVGKADLYRNKPEAEMKKALEKILDAGQRATEILERFKNLSNKPEQNGPKELKDVNRIIDDAVDLMEHSLETSVTKICRIKSDKAELLCYPTSLLQVFVNLIVNASHAMGSPGQIDISVIDRDKQVDVIVRDYGPGIKPELLEKVMEPFFTTKGRGGSGLGLPICKEIVEIEHGGEFEIRNHGVKGLEAVLHLPKGESNG